MFKSLFMKKKKELEKQVQKPIEAKPILDKVEVKEEKSLEGVRVMVRQNG
jgi:hypothetical protein